MLFRTDFPPDDVPDHATKDREDRKIISNYKWLEQTPLFMIRKPKMVSLLLMYLSNLYLISISNYKNKG